MGEGGGRTLAEALRLNTTLTSLNLSDNGLGEGGGRALAEGLRLNTTLSCRSTLVGITWKWAEGGRWQRHCA